MTKSIHTDQLKADLTSAEIKNLGKNVFMVKTKDGDVVLEVLEIEVDKKKMGVRHNHATYTLEFKNSLDEVLSKMGIERGKANKGGDIVAPMPGKILDVLTEEGATINEGDPVFVLEAMKMENVLKSNQEGIVDRVSVKKGQNVEKNEVLLQIKS